MFCDRYVPRLILRSFTGRDNCGVQNKHSGENSMRDCERLRRGFHLWTRGFSDNIEAAKMTSLQGSQLSLLLYFLIFLTYKFDMQIWPANLTCKLNLRPANCPVCVHPSIAKHGRSLHVRAEKLIKAHCLPLDKSLKRRSAWWILPLTIKSAFDIVWTYLHSEFPNCTTLFSFQMHELAVRSCGLITWHTHNYRLAACIIIDWLTLRGPSLLGQIIHNQPARLNFEFWFGLAVSIVPKPTRPHRSQEARHD